MSRILTAALFVFTLSAPVMAGTAPEGITLRAYVPVGNGDPNAISCWAYRTTPPVRGLRCARNSYWARLNAGSHFLRRATRFSRSHVRSLRTLPVCLQREDIARLTHQSFAKFFQGLEINPQGFPFL